jgi:hypothetical protein
VVYPSDTPATNNAAESPIITSVELNVLLANLIKFKIQTMQLPCCHSSHVLSG